MKIESLEELATKLTANEPSENPFKADDISPFPQDVFPENIQIVAKELQWAYKAPAELVWCFILGCVSACLGKGICLRTHHPDLTYGLLYQMVCTMPGVNKSTILKWLLKPIVEYQRNARESQRSEVERQLITDSKSQKIPTKKEIDAEIGKAIPTLMVEHSSQEGLATSLSYNDEYLAVISSDCSGVVDALKGSKNGGSFQGEILLKGYSGDAYNTNYKQAVDEHLEEVRLSVTWAGTDRALTDFVCDKQIVERGLLSRFLFTFIDEPVPRRDIECRRISRDKVDSWASMLTSLLDKYWNKGGHQEVESSIEARRLNIQFDNQRIDFAGDLSHLGGLPERWAENALRIALVVHCMKHLGNATSKELSEDTMESAIRITRWFIGRQIAWIESLGNYDEVVESLKVRIFNYLERNGPTTSRNLQRSAGLKKRYTYMLNKWVKDGELITWDASNGARPSPTYALAGDDRAPDRLK
ncbi:YfjI family protein [Opitutales bacterium]|nr:YfjI family protein [Opitutales bacterium]